MEYANPMKALRDHVGDEDKKPFGKPFRRPFKPFQKTRKFMTKAFMAHGDCSDESCCEKTDDESADHEGGMTTYYCQSCGADDEFEDAADRITQDIVTAFFANVETEEEIDAETAEICAQSVYSEQAFTETVATPARRIAINEVRMVL